MSKSSSLTKRAVAVRGASTILASSPTLANLFVFFLLLLLRLACERRIAALNHAHQTGPNVSEPVTKALSKFCRF